MLVVYLLENLRPEILQLSFELLLILAVSFESRFEARLVSLDVGDKTSRQFLQQV